MKTITFKLVGWNGRETGRFYVITMYHLKLKGKFYCRNERPMMLYETFLEGKMSNMRANLVLRRMYGTLDEMGLGMIVL